MHNQHFVKHVEAQGAYNFYTMIKHQLSILDILSQVALAALDELIHNLVGVFDGEVTQDRMHHVSISLLLANCHCMNLFCWGLKFGMIRCVPLQPP